MASVVLTSPADAARGCPHAAGGPAVDSRPVREHHRLAANAAFGPSRIPDLRPANGSAGSHRAAATPAATPGATWWSAAPLASTGFAVSPPAPPDERLLPRHPDHRRDRSTAPRRSAGRALGLPAHRTPLQREPDRRDQDDDGGPSGDQHQPQAATTANASRATRMRRRRGQGTRAHHGRGTQRFHGRHSPARSWGFRIDDRPGVPRDAPSRRVCCAGAAQPLQPR